MKLNKNLMYRLLKFFSIAIILAVTFFSLLVSLIVGLDNKKEARLLSQNSMNRVSLYLENNMAKQAKIVQELSNMELKYNSIASYFSMELPEYLEYTLATDYVSSNFPKVLSERYYEDSDITSMSIDYVTSKYRYYSDNTNKTGKKVTTLPKSTGIQLNKTIHDPASLKMLGTFYLTVNKATLDNNITNLFGDYQSDVYIISDTNSVIYTNSSNLKLQDQIEKWLKLGKTLTATDFEKKYFVPLNEVDGYKVVSLVDRSIVLKRSLLWMLSLFTISLCLNGLLILLLVRLFKGYLYQIEDILSNIKEVSGGNLSNRISLANKESELADISNGINEMLDGMNLFIKENYELDIKQKEAEFRALQAQINPHFMYNTLEYIRMYAYSEGMTELAKVVYSFASILRNNISQDRMISLKKEMTFIEQYVYLYQTRYPDNIAYSFSIASQVEHIEIPKFCLQPLVENYFTHGIDYDRVDNAISVKAYREEEGLVFKITDNGRGMSDEKLTEINTSLSEGSFASKTSIGIQNVDERLKIIFGEGYKMKFFKEQPSGITIIISINLEGGSIYV